MFITKCQNYSSDQTKTNEMAEAYGTYGEEETCTLGFVGKTWKKEKTSKARAYVGE